MTDEAQPPHPTSVAVWGAPSPVPAGGRFTVTVGVKCAAACPLAGFAVLVRDAAGREIGRATLGPEPAAGTRALYAAAVGLTAPPDPGVHTWTAAFPGGAAAPLAAGAGSRPRPAPGAAAEPGREPQATPEPASAPRREARSGPRPETAPATRRETEPRPRHETAASTFSFRAVEPPEHGVTLRVTVVDGVTEVPLGNADVHLGRYRAATGADGQAHIEAPAGEYELYVRRPGYAPYSDPVAVTGDTALRVAAARITDTDDDDEVWM